MTELNQTKVPWWKRKPKRLSYKEWLVEGLGWGIMMFFIMTFILEEEPYTFIYILRNIIVWLVAGLFWGSIMYALLGKKKSKDLIN